MRSSVFNTRTFPGEDCGSDHQLMCIDTRYKVKPKKKCTPVMRLDVVKIPATFSVEVQNQYTALVAVEDERHAGRKETLVLLLVWSTVTQPRKLRRRVERTKSNIFCKSAIVLKNTVK